MTENSTSQLLAALHDSQARLTAALDGLSVERAGAQSYDDEWSIADVASHLGSGAVLFTDFLDAGLTGGPEPDMSGAQAVWDAWNGKDPQAQAADSVAANAAFIARLDALTSEERDGWSLELFGATRDLDDFLRMRLSEHAIHTWDIEVASNPDHTIPAPTAGTFVDNVLPIAGWIGKKRDEAVSVDVRTTDPELAYRLEIGPDAVSIAPGGGGAAATLSLPTEAFIRLVYGRLDPDHTPASVRADGVDLDVLRETFPGV